MASNDVAIKKNIVILGASYAGVSVAHYVLKHVFPALPEQESYRIIVVSAASQAMCRTGCPRAIISDDMFPQDKFFVSVPKQFEQYPSGSFQFIRATATGIDTSKRTVSIHNTEDQTQLLDYHALVIATGASTPSPLFSFVHGEESLHQAWAEFRKGLATAKSIIIVGGGPTGIETAGELGEYINGPPRWFRAKSDNMKVQITVITGAAKILPLLRTSIAKTAEEYLSNVGVQIIKEKRVVSVDPPNAGAQIESLASGATLSLSDGTKMNCDLFIPATGFSPNTSFLTKDLLTPTGQVDTDARTLRVNKAGARVYAIGDASSFARPAIHNILSAVPVLAANLKRDLLIAAGMPESEAGSEREFKEDTKEMQLVPIGKSKGVGAAMGWRMPSFMVWLIKGRDYWLWTLGNLWNGKQWAKTK